MFGASPRVAAATSITFVAPTTDPSLEDRLGLGSRVVACKNTRRLDKTDMPENDAMPDVRVDADTFAVFVDGERIEAAPATELPMAQRYFLF
jgi:urease subunit alpha